MLSSNGTNLQEFSGELKLLNSWAQVCSLMGSDSKEIAPPILLQSCLEHCMRNRSSKPSSLLEASMQLAQALSDEKDDISTLNIHMQLQLSDLYVEHGNAHYAERLLKMIPPVNASSQILNWRTNLSLALSRSKLQHLCGESSLACAKLSCALQETSRCLSSTKLSQDLSTRLLLETYLSTNIVLCKWLAETGSMSFADLISQKLKPVI